MELSPLAVLAAVASAIILAQQNAMNALPRSLSSLSYSLSTALVSLFFPSFPSSSMHASAWVLVGNVPRLRTQARTFASSTWAQGNHLTNDLLEVQHDLLRTHVRYAPIACVET